MTQCWIALVFGVELEKALARTALPQPDPSNEDTTWPLATDAPAALGHPMKAELVRRFALPFDDFGVFGSGWQSPTVVGYPVGKSIALHSDGQVTSLATLNADLAEAERLYADKMKVVIKALYPGRSDVKPELKMYSFALD